MAVMSRIAAAAVLSLMGAGQRVPVPRKPIRTRAVSKTSTMPEGLLDGFGMNDIADLFAFLQGGK